MEKKYYPKIKLKFPSLMFYNAESKPIVNWGDIKGLIKNQTDLSDSLDNKVDIINLSDNLVTGISEDPLSLDTTRLLIDSIDPQDGDISTVNLDLLTANASKSGIMSYQTYNTVTGLSTDVTTLQGDVSDIQQDVSNINSDITTINNNISTLQDNVITIQGDISTLESDVTTIQSDLSTVQGDITTLQGDVAANTSNIQINTGDISTINGNITTIQSDVTTLQGDVATNTGNIATNAQNITNLQGNVTTIQGNITTINGDITTLQGDVTQNTTDIATNASDISDLQTDKVDISKIGNSVVTGISEDTANVNTTLLTIAKVDPQYGTTSNVDLSLQLQSDSKSGIMAYSSYNQIVKNTQDIAQLQGTGKIYPVQDQLPETLTQQEVLAIYQNVSGETDPKDNDSILSINTQTLNYEWTYYESLDTWICRYDQQVEIQTNSMPGIVQGENTNGKIFVENDGTMSLVGYDAITTDITNLQSDDQTNVQDIQNLKDDVSKNTTDIGTLQTNVTNIKTDINNIQSDITAIEGDITNIQSDVTIIEGDITTLQGDVATNTSNISTNTSNISTIQGDVTTIQGDITTLQGEMDDKVDVSKIGNNVLTGLSEETTFSSRTTLIANNVDPSDGTTSSTYITLELQSKTRSGIMPMEAYQDLQTAKTDLQIDDKKISDLQTDVSTIQGDITTINGDITTIQGDITTIQGDITNIESKTETATNTNLGIVKGNTTNGKISILSDGSMQLNGYETVPPFISKIYLLDEQHFNMTATKDQTVSVYAFSDGSPVTVTPTTILQGIQTTFTIGMETTTDDFTVTLN